MQWQDASKRRGPTSNTHRISRRIAASAVGVGLLARPSWAQQPNRVSRVLWISPGGSPADERSYEAHMEAK
jgi:hypothetical protein